jgi:hypothetical protein
MAIRSSGIRITSWWSESVQPVKAIAADPKTNPVFAAATEKTHTASTIEMMNVIQLFFTGKRSSAGFTGTSGF